MSAWRAANFRSSLSFAVSAGSCSSLPGKLMPLSAPSLLPVARAWVMRIVSPPGCGLLHEASYPVPSSDPDFLALLYTGGMISGSVQLIVAACSTRPRSSSHRRAARQILGGEHEFIAGAQAQG